MAIGQIARRAIAALAICATLALGILLTAPKSQPQIKLTATDSSACVETAAQIAGAILGVKEANALTKLTDTQKGVLVAVVSTLYSTARDCGRWNGQNNLNYICWSTRHWYAPAFLATRLMVKTISGGVSWTC